MYGVAVLLPHFFRCTFQGDCVRSETLENWLDISSGVKKCPKIQIIRSSKDKVRGKILICPHCIVSFCTADADFLLCVKYLLAIKHA